MEDHFKGHFSSHFANHKSHMGGDFDFNSIFDEDLFGKSLLRPRESHCQVYTTD